MKIKILPFLIFVCLIALGKFPCFAQQGEIASLSIVAPQVYKQSDDLGFSFSILNLASKTLTVHSIFTVPRRLKLCSPEFSHLYCPFIARSILPVSVSGLYVSCHTLPDPFREFFQIHLFVPEQFSYDKRKNWYGEGEKEPNFFDPFPSPETTNQALQASCGDASPPTIGLHIGPAQHRFSLV